MAALALALASAPAGAACTVSTQPVLFGTYDWQNTAPTDGIGAIHVACDAVTDFVVAMGVGQTNNGTIDDRRLNLNAGTNIKYNLYTDASRSTLWGDGAVGATVSGSGTSIDLPVYGRMPALQKVRAGLYVDSVLVTVTF